MAEVKALADTGIVDCTEQKRLNDPPTSPGYVGAQLIGAVVGSLALLLWGAMVRTRHHLDSDHHRLFRGTARPT